MNNPSIMGSMGDKKITFLMIRLIFYLTTLIFWKKILSSFVLINLLHKNSMGILNRRILISVFFVSMEFLVIQNDLGMAIGQFF